MSALATSRGAILRRRLLNPFTIVMIVVVLIVLLIVVFPMVKMIQEAFLPDGAFTWEPFVGAFAGYGFAKALLNTVILAIVPTILAVLVAVPLAWLSERTDARMGALTTILPLGPLVIPPIVLSIGWLFLADPRSGFLVELARLVVQPFGGTVEELSIGIESMPGLVFLYAVTMVPVIYVVCAAAFRRLDPSLEEAGLVSGKGRLRIFFQIALPAVRPAIAAGALLSVIAGMGLYSIVATVGAPAKISVLSTYIFGLVNGTYPPKIPEATALGLALVAVMSVLWYVQQRIVRGMGRTSAKAVSMAPKPLPLGRWRLPIRILMIVYVGVTLVAPLIGLVLVSLEAYWTPDLSAGDLSFAHLLDALSAPTTVTAIVNSVVIAVVVATLVILFAALLTVGEREVGGPVMRVVGIVSKVPSVVPNIVFGVGVLVAFGFAPFGLNGTIGILVVAFSALYIPTAMISSEAAIEQVGNPLIEAARTAGAGRARIFRRISLPLMVTGLAAGWAIVFAHIMSDYNVAAILSGPKNPVIGYVILGVFQSGTYGQAAALGVLIGIVSTVVIGSVLILSGRRRRRDGGSAGVTGSAGTLQS